MKSIINIPNPCSEDWTKMTPTTKGAFCGACQFEVTDFTNKDPEEIRAILKANAGKKTCGHISKVQLEMVNSDYHLWDNQPVPVFRSKFLYACLIVFGMALFTGCSDYSQEYEVGEVAPIDQVQDVGMIEEDTTASCNGDDIMFNGDVVDGMMVEELGEISIEEE
jgi:hypothetical protein